MAALMRMRSMFVFTHDSIGLGEDGPTHQPIEQLSSLRLIPNMDVWRPCDTVESVVAWAAALERTDGPTSLIFSRQNLPFQSRPAGAEEVIRRGGYVLRRTAGAAAGRHARDGLGSCACGRGAKALARAECPGPRRVDAIDDGVRSSARWLSAIRAAAGLPCVAIEAGASDLWRKYVGRSGAVVGIDRFGESAPAGDLLRHFGFTRERVVDAVMQVLSQGHP